MCMGEGKGSRLKRAGLGASAGISLCCPQFGGRHRGPGQGATLRRQAWRCSGGQWSMVHACPPQSEPILGTGGKKNPYIMHKLVSSLAEILNP